MNNKPFFILESIDSTNNYAIAQIRDNMATHGSGFFAIEQTKGKGQWGKNWQSEKGKNILLSVILGMDGITVQQQAIFNMQMALTCQRFVQQNTKFKTFIKWPNDIYCNDRKAGGILIENIFLGEKWKWSIVGIGVNVNETTFESLNATSLFLLEEKKFDVIEMSKQLHKKITEGFEAFKTTTTEEILQLYNHHLYKKDELVKLKYQNTIIETAINHVDEQGYLITNDTEQRKFLHGEVEWQL